MRSFQRIWAAWSADPLLRRVISNSSRLFSSNILSAGLGFLNGILATRLLGMDGYGLVSGVVIVFVSNINRFLTFRMSEVVVKRLGGALAQENRPEAAASLKLALLTETITSLMAYLVLLALAPWAAASLAKDASLTGLFRFYGLILLTNFTAESSTGVLQAARRFGQISLINILQSCAITAVILAAFLTRGSAWEVIAAYVLGKSINGLGLTLLAWRQASATLGRGWWKTPLSALPDRRGMLLFMLNTNLNGTVNLFTRDNISLYLAAILSTTEVGYFKLAQSLVNLILMPLDPLIWPTYTEITQTVAKKDWDATRQLLRRVSLLTGTVVFTVSAGLALTGWFLIPWLYRPDAAPAYPALLILLLGYGFASIFQWNRPLLLALGRPGLPVLIALFTGILELFLIFWLVPRHGYLWLAVILSSYFIVSIGLTAWRGLAEIQNQSQTANQKP